MNQKPRKTHDANVINAVSKISGANEEKDIYVDQIWRIGSRFMLIIKTLPLEIGKKLRSFLNGLRLGLYRL